MSQYNVNIFASFQQCALVDPQQALFNYGSPSVYLNTSPVSQTCTISAHNIADITNLNITSNGISNDSFSIFPVKYTGEQIYFVVKLQDYNGFDVKDYNLLALSSFQFSLSSYNGSNVNNVSFSSNFGTLSTLTQGGFFKGFLTSPSSASNVSICAIYTDSNISLTGFSSTFTVYPSAGVYNLRKINEDFDQTAAFNSLVLQPILIDKTQFFDGFLGQIVGNANSDPNTLGIEVYEKISNYISNLQDVEYCNLDALKSMFDMLNISYQDFNYVYPPSLKRLVDILSVKHKQIFGQSNQYQGNYDTKGFTNSNIYGLNRGAKLPIATTILSAGAYPGFILTYEKFSKKYNLVSTNIVGFSSYPLSAVNNTWGWNLVLPPNGGNVSSFYDFYQYTPGVEGSYQQKFIDFNNINNTLAPTNSSYNDFIKTGGIIDNILLYNLYTNLGILS